MPQHQLQLNPAQGMSREECDAQCHDHLPRLRPEQVHRQRPSPLARTMAP
jgi:hypothetical protein